MECVACYAYVSEDKMLCLACKAERGDVETFVAVAQDVEDYHASGERRTRSHVRVVREINGGKDAEEVDEFVAPGDFSDAMLGSGFHPISEWVPLKRTVPEPSDWFEAKAVRT